MEIHKKEIFQGKEVDLIIETIEDEEGIRNYNKGVEFIISLMINKYNNKIEGNINTSVE